MALSRRTNPPNGEALIYLAFPLWPIQSCRTKLSVRQSGESFLRGYEGSVGDVGGGGGRNGLGPVLLFNLFKFCMILRKKLLVLAPF